jgi:hypothetical protein
MLPLKEKQGHLEDIPADVTAGSAGQPDPAHMKAYAANPNAWTTFRGCFNLPCGLPPLSAMGRMKCWHDLTKFGIALPPSMQSLAKSNLLLILNESYL